MGQSTITVIEKFYTAFQKKDAEGMVECYHEDIVFEDPAFGELKGENAKNMWRMLCSNATDLELTYSNITEDTAYWEAIYTFSQTGRKIHNKIRAKFEFREGKIVGHRDSFNLHKWATQAMGFKGWLLGGTGYFRKKLQHQTHKALVKFTKFKSANT